MGKNTSSEVKYTKISEALSALQYKDSYGTNVYRVCHLSHISPQEALHGAREMIILSLCSC